MSLLASLLRPLTFLRVRHPAKRRLDMSALILGLFIGICAIVLRQLNVAAPNGLIQGMNGLFQILVGFYIAALAAVATFDGKGRGYDMDRGLAHRDATLTLTDGSVEVLSRRHLLALLLGYLALSSLGLYLAGLIASLVAPLLHTPGLNSYLTISRTVFLILYSPAIVHVFATTLLGLYFLSYRMNIAVDQAGPRTNALPTPLEKYDSKTTPTFH